MRLAGLLRVLFVAVMLTISLMQDLYAQEKKIPSEFYERVLQQRRMPLIPASIRSSQQEDSLRRISTERKITKQTDIPDWIYKVDPLLFAKEPQVKRGKFSAGMVSRVPATPLLVKKESSDGSIQREVLIEIEPGSDLSDLQGVELRSVSPEGNFVIGSIAEIELPSIASDDRVKRIEASVMHYPLHVNSRGLIGVDKVQAGTGIPFAYRGKGVVVGVLDSGIDADNPDFSDENGTRIQYLLEYLNGGGSNEWSKAQMDANPSSVTQIDGAGGSGHGTHVAGTAAGGGKLNSNYTGMAPESDLVIVKGVRDADSDGGFFTSDILSGVEYIFNKATTLGKPAVVNLSLGSTYGSLDGTSAYEQYLSQLQGDGRIIVAAAGNSGMDYYHVGGNLQPNSYYLHVDAPYFDTFYYKNIWADAGVIDSYKIVAFRVAQTDSATTPYIAAESEWFDLGTAHMYSEGAGIELRDTVANEPAGFIYHYSLDTLNTRNGDSNIYIEIDDGYPARDDYAWVNRYFWGILFKTTSQAGRMDSWAYQALSLPYAFANLSVGGQSVTSLLSDRNYSVGTPSTANNVISVGAFVSTSTFTLDDGSSRSISYPTDYSFTNYYTPQVGEIAYFSSRGPTRDGRQAPLISAPGDRIFSTRSRDITDQDLGLTTVDSGNYSGLAGTSMATPHITGVIALLLQINPTLDYADLVSIFNNTSTTDGFTGAVPNTIFGYGKINAYDAVVSLAGTAANFEQWNVVMNDATLDIGESAILTLSTQAVQQSDNLYSFSFDLSLPDGITFESTSVTGTLAAQGSVTTSVSGSTVNNSVSSSTPLYGTGELIKLVLSGSRDQSVPIIPQNMSLNGKTPGSVTGGTLTILPGPISAVTLQTPANMSTEVSRTPTLRWNRIAAATQYRVQLSTNSFVSLSLDTTLTDTLFLSPQLESGTTYSWRVKASDSDVSGPWSAEWTFKTVVEPVQQVILRNPSDDERNLSLTPEFIWAKDRVANQYRLQLSRNNFSSVYLEVVTADTTAKTRTLESGTEYQWRVQASNEAGAGSWSEVRTFTTQFNPVGAITLNYPFNGEVNVPASPEFQWQSDPNASQYTVQISTDSFQTYRADTTLSDTTLTLQGLAKNTLFSWRVRGLNESGIGEWSPVWIFKTEVDPVGKVALSFPENASTGVVLNPVLSWVQDPNADHYRVTLSSDGFETTILDSTLSATSIQVNGLANSREYNWQVLALNDAGNGPWSDIWTFTTQRQIPGTIRLSSPANKEENVSVKPVLQWIGDSNAESYVVNVFTNDFITEVVDEVVIDTFFVMPQLKYANDYYWRVRGQNESGRGGWSDSWIFKTIDDPIEAPAPFIPYPGQMDVGTEATFHWSRVAEATEYDIQAAEDSMFTSIKGAAEGLTDTTFTLLTPLHVSTAHYWRVRARNADQDRISEWSTPVFFITGVRTTTDEIPLPFEYVLEQNYPNPFNPTTQIRFSLPEAMEARLEVFTLLGQSVGVIVEGPVKAGYHTVTFDASGLPSGVYLYRLITPMDVRTQVMILMK